MARPHPNSKLYPIFERILEDFGATPELRLLLYGYGLRTDEGTAGTDEADVLIAQPPTPDPDAVAVFSRRYDRHAKDWLLDFRLAGPDGEILLSLSLHRGAWKDFDPEGRRDPRVDLLLRQIGLERDLVPKDRFPIFLHTVLKALPKGLPRVCRSRTDANPHPS